MRDYKHRPLRVSHYIHAPGNDPQRIDVESGIRLIQNRELRFEHSHLQNFVPLLLAAREAFIHRAIHELLVHLQKVQFFPVHREEIHGVHLILAAVSANRIQRGP